MDRNRLLLIGALLAAMVVGALGFIVGIEPQLSAATTARTQNAAVVTQNASLASGITSLRSKFSKLDSLTTQLSELQASVPDNAASGPFLTGLNDMVTKTGMTINTLTIGDPQAYVAPIAAPVAKSTSKTASTLPVAPAAVTSPLITGKNFSTVSVTMTLGGTYAQALNMLEQVQTGNRMFLVTAFSGSSDAASDGSTGNWTIGGYIYALTDATSAQATQEQSTSTAAGTTTDGSSTDTAAGK